MAALLPLLMLVAHILVAFGWEPSIIRRRDDAAWNRFVDAMGVTR